MSTTEDLIRLNETCGQWSVVSGQLYPAGPPASNILPQEIMTAAKPRRQSRPREIFVKTKSSKTAMDQGDFQDKVLSGCKIGC